MVLKPYIEACFTSSDWKIHESAVLCLGTISEGSFESIQLYLNNFLKNLLDRIFICKEDEYLLKSCTLWTVSKYTNWIADNN